MHIMMKCDTGENTIVIIKALCRICLTDLKCMLDLPRILWCAHCQPKMAYSETCKYSKFNWSWSLFCSQILNKNTILVFTRDKKSSRFCRRLSESVWNFSRDQPNKFECLPDSRGFRLKYTHFQESLQFFKANTLQYNQIFYYR